jgi:peptidoglycan hydrolase CwlO-like protein
MKRKNEEMKAKIYSLRTQKMELDRRILEKQSSIDSLKDEQRAVESALEEKQKEIKMLREKQIDPGKENPQVMALMESLKQKEAEIEDLKHRIEHPVKVWSVSTDDPSSPPVNLTENS